MTPGTGLLRLTRAAFFAVSAVGLAVAAHLAAGDVVPVSSVLLAVPAVMLVVHRLAAGRRGPVGLFIGMGLAQIALHVGFMAMSAAVSCAQAPAMTGMAMGVEHGHVQVACQASGDSVATGQVRPSGAVMLLGHALACALLVLLLARGEAAIWALAASFRFRFLLPGPAVRLPATRRLPVAAAAARRPANLVHLRSVRRRGPPVQAGAVR